MKKIIEDLKARIEKNNKCLKKEDDTICDLVKPTLEIINLLLISNASNNKIKHCLKTMNGTISIIEEKLERVEKKK